MDTMWEVIMVEEMVENSVCWMVEGMAVSMADQLVALWDVYSVALREMQLVERMDTMWEVIMVEEMVENSVCWMVEGMVVSMADQLVALWDVHSVVWTVEHSAYW